MKIHLIAPPNCQTIRECSLDGFTAMTIRFAKVLRGICDRVTIYGSEECEAPCDEFVPCFSQKDIDHFLTQAGVSYQAVKISQYEPLFSFANTKYEQALRRRWSPGDIIAHIGGTAHKPLTDQFLQCSTLEYSIGYEGTYAPFRVFQSRAWQHFNYGMQHIRDGRFYDAVIPGFFDPSEFDISDPEPDNYFLYVGRLTTRKGIGVACDAARHAGVNLKVVGHGDASLVTYGEYLGPVPWEERNYLMSRARAVLCPTIYIEPFNCVAVEAQMCGTPVITTDFGGFTETVEQGKTGLRCTLLGDFVRAIKDIDEDRACCSRWHIRQRATKLYSLETAQVAYAQYFARLKTLQGAGWNTL